MTKQIILSGSETKLAELGGQNVIVQNLGANTIHASINPNIVPGADNVIEIPAGGGVNVYGANGTIYLMGTGKVQCTGTDYSTVNFKMPSSVTIIDGGEQPIETMPVMDGIDAYFVPETFNADTNVWENAVNTDNVSDVVFFHGEAGIEDHHVLIPNRTVGFVNPNSPVKTIYIASVPKDQNSISSSNSAFALAAPPYIRAYFKTGVTNHPFTISGTSSNYAANAMRIYCITVIDDTHYILYSSSDDSVNRITSNSSTMNNWKTIYVNGVLVYGNMQNMLYDFLAFGSTVHTEEQIRQNFAWLTGKYGIGGG